MSYELSYPNVTDVNLTATVNFAPSGLTPNAEAVAKGLQLAYLAGGGGLSNFLTYLATLDFGPFAAGLNRLTPEPYLAQSQPRSGPASASPIRCSVARFRAAEPR